MHADCESISAADFESARAAAKAKRISELSRAFAKPKRRPVGTDMRKPQVIRAEEKRRRRGTGHGGGPKPTPVAWGGVAYASLSEAARATGINRHTLRWRLNNPAKNRPGLWGVNVSTTG